jgi:hypothetical protein
LLDAETAIEELYERVRGDNGYKENEPKEHESVESSLSAGLAMIKNVSHIAKPTIEALILNPARYLSEKFAEKAVGELAKTVVLKVLSWLANS